MVPTKVTTDAEIDLLAADAATLAPAVSGNKVSLVIAPFTPGPDTDVTTLTLATFTGGAAKVAGTGAQTTGFDPITLREFIQILEPAGGWSWVCTGAPAAPETVYGVVLTNNGVTVTYGAELLPAPVTITNVGDAVAVGFLRFYQGPDSLQ